MPERAAAYGLTYRNRPGERFKVRADVGARLRSHAQLEGNAREAGGALLGRYIIDASDVVVDDATTPMEMDQRGRHRFVRQPVGHQEVVDAVWRNSQGTCHYLGEWHTHPEPVPSPSRVDIMNWKRLLAKYRDDPDSLYFVIVGTEHINVWQGYKGTLELELLIQESETR